MIHNSLFKKLHRYLFYLLIVLLPTQLGFHFWPDWAMVLGRRIDYLSPTLYFTDILIIMILLFWFVEVITRIMNYESGIRNKPIIHYSLFIILLLFVAGNTYFSFRWKVALYHWLKFAEFGLLVFYIIKTKPSLRTTHYALAIAILYSSILAIWQFAIQHSVGGVFWFLGERTFSSDTSGIAQISLGNLGLRLRPYATFPHPNVLGGFLAVVLPLLINEYTNKRINELRKVLYILTITMGTIALVLTFSRAAWIVGGVGIVFSFIQMRKRESGIMNYESWKYILGFIICITLYSLFIIHNSSEESVVVRQQLNGAAINIWKVHPMFGVGLGNFLVALPDFVPSRLIYFLQPVHNIYLLLLSEVGVVGVGLIVFIGFYILNHESGIMNYGKHKTMIHYSLFIILVLGLADHYLLTLQQGQLLFTVIISLCLMVQYSHAPDANSRRVEPSGANHW